MPIFEFTVEARYNRRGYAGAYKTIRGTARFEGTTEHSAAVNLHALIALHRMSMLDRRIEWHDVPGADFEYVDGSFCMRLTECGQLATV